MGPIINYNGKKRILVEYVKYTILFILRSKSLNRSMLREQFVQHRDHKLMSIALTSAADRRTRWITIPRSCIKLPDIYRCLVLLPLWTCQSGFKFSCCKQTRFIKAILIYRLHYLVFWDNYT